MSNLFQKIKEFYKKLTIKKLSYDRDDIKPKHDWAIILIVGQTIVCIGVVISLYIFIQADSGKLFVLSKGAVSNETTINTVLFKKIVDEINLRETSLKTITEIKVIPADPSI